VDLRFLPDEWPGGLVIAGDEGFDMRPQSGDGVERCAGKRFSGEDREPDFHLIEPGCLCGREVEADVRMAFEPAVIFGLMGVKIVENDMDFAAGMCGNDAVHEVEELDPAPPFVMPPRYCAGRHIEGREQRGGPVPFITEGFGRL
jgi:hypothetical protein